MNTDEQRIREFAYQIWKSEGQPVGDDFRHWEMARTMVAAQNEDNPGEKVTGHLPSAIAPEEPANPDPAPEIDPAPTQPSPPPRPDTQPQPNEPSSPDVPVDPISPNEPTPPTSPTPTPQPIHPTDPVEPGNPTHPIQPYASRSTSAATRLALNEDGVKPAEKKKQTKSHK